MKHILLILTLVFTFTLPAVQAADKEPSAGALCVIADRVKHGDKLIKNGITESSTNFDKFEKSARRLIESEKLSPDEIHDLTRAFEHLFITLGQPRLNPLAEKFFGADIQAAKETLAQRQLELLDRIEQVKKTVKK